MKWCSGYIIVKYEVLTSIIWSPFSKNKWGTTNIHPHMENTHPHIYTATVWMFVSLPNSNAEVLMPNVMTLGGGNFGHEGGVLTNKIYAFINKARKSSLASSGMWRHRKKSAPRRGPSADRAADHADLGLPASKTVRNRLLLITSCLDCGILL